MLVVGWCAIYCSFQKDGRHIRSVGGKKIASLEWRVGLFSLSHLFFLSPLSRRRPDKTEILLTGTLTLSVLK